MRNGKNRLLFILAFVLAIIFVYFIAGRAEIIMQQRKGEIFFKKGLNHYHQYQYIAAIEYFTKSISEYSQFALARRYLAAAYWRAGYADYAKKEWSTYIELFPDDPIVRNRLQQVLQWEKNLAGRAFVPLISLKTLNIDRIKKGICIFFETANGHIWLAGMNSGNIAELDSRGNLINQFKASRELFGLPYAVVATDEKIYVSDFQKNLIHVLSKSGRGLQEIGKRGTENGSFHGPAGLAVSREGHLYVADSANHRVQKFSSDGSFVLAFGEEGSAAGQLNQPIGVVLLEEQKNNSIYILEKGNQRIQKFDMYGNAEGQWEVSLEEPISFSSDANYLYITDLKKGIIVFDLTTKEFFPYLKMLAPDLTEKIQKLNFAGMLVDSHGHHYLLEYEPSRIHVLAAQDLKMSNLNVEILSIDTKKFPVMGMRFRVFDTTGKNLSFLNQDNMIVMDEDVRLKRINPAAFHYRHEAVYITLLVDNSLFMKSYLQDLEWVLKPLWNDFYQSDRIQVKHFGNGVREELGFDWSVRRAEQAVMRVKLSKERHLDAALYESISHLLPLMHKKALIVLLASDVDQSSFLQYGERTIRHYAQVHDVPIYVISFSGHALQNLANDTGGKWLKAYDELAMRKILPELRKRNRMFYQISYQSFQNATLKNQPRKVTLKIDYRNQTGVAETHYLNP